MNAPPRLRLVLAGVLLTFSSGASTRSGQRIAITVDDVPWNGERPPLDALLALTDRLLQTLAAHHAPVAAFANCDTTGAFRVALERWMAAGAVIGNHTTGHVDLNQVRPQRWADAVRSCDRVLRRIVGTPVGYFRFPLLHQGRDETARSVARAVLRELGYEIAHVTIDNSDYLLAGPYAAAVRSGDDGTRKRIGRTMVDHDLRATRHFQAVARRKLGRDVAHVLLLHVNHMTVDNLDALLTGLEQAGFAFVSLDVALADPVYRRGDLYVGPRGLSWLYRIAPLTPADAEWDDTEAQALRGDFARP